MSADFWSGESRTRAAEPALSPERIEVYLLSPEAVTDQTAGRLAAVLDDGELDRCQKLAFAADRHSFLVSHGLVRFALSRHADVAPGAWRFQTNRFGRPEIADPAHANRLRFNLSHTIGLIAVAVARGRDVGVDVENTTRELPIEAAEKILSSVEIDQVRSLPEPQRRQRLFVLWTLKEAYAKGRGLGLSLPLREFSFRVDDPATGDGIELRCRRRGGLLAVRIASAEPGPLPGPGL